MVGAADTESRVSKVSGDGQLWQSDVDERESHDRSISSSKASALIFVRRGKGPIMGPLEHRITGGNILSTAGWKEGPGTSRCRIFMYRLLNANWIQKLQLMDKGVCRFAGNRRALSTRARGN